MSPGPCYRCGGYGHFAADCPELRPAASRAEHYSRIDLYAERWITGKWTTQQKRDAITQENKMWETQMTTARKG